jgi:carbamoyl-phosphate synthase small subunit
MQMQKARLILENGDVFQGWAFAAVEGSVGEVVFNTSMTGYQEVLTDPSYAGQIVCMTYPLIGNYGVNREDCESIQPRVKGLIVREFEKQPSNFRNEEAIDGFLMRFGIPGLCDIDTRALTRTLRECGTMRGMIHIGEDCDIPALMPKIRGYQIVNPVMDVTVKAPEVFAPQTLKYRVALMDYGYKKSIVRSLVKRGCEVTVFPADTTAAAINDFNPDGIMLTNGPGDPKDCGYAIRTIGELLGTRPLFGICLGHQLAALSQGADTAKLKYGHRGANHPVKDLQLDKAYITSQNHGYTVLASSLDAQSMRLTHLNLNDNTPEGIEYVGKNAFTVQFHPEASPGPHETSYLFDRFIDMMEANKGER